MVEQYIADALELVNQFIKQAQDGDYIDSMELYGLWRILVDVKYMLMGLTPLYIEGEPDFYKEM